MLRMMQHAGNRNKNNIDWQLWQQHNHPIEITNNKILQQKLEYIHLNPVKAGFVAEPQDYVYSSALDYSGGKGLLPVEVLEVFDM